MISITTSPALKSLVAWLARPLILTTSPTTVARLQRLLETNLSTLFPASNAPSFTFIFSPTTLPPAPLYTACLSAGLTWSAWTAVFGGQDMHFFVSETCIKMSFSPLVSKNIPTLTIWEKEDENKAVSAPMLAATLDSVRARRLRSPVSDVSDGTDSSDESDSDSLFSAASSTSSVSSPASSTCELPLPAAKVAAVPAAPALYRVKRTGLTPTHSRKSSASSVTATAPKVQVKAQYVYEGGRTNVMTGGVMLGAAAVPKFQPARSSKTVKTWRSL